MQGNFQKRELSSIDTRLTKLSDSLQKDCEKLFDQMNGLQNTTEKNESQLKQLNLGLNELISKKDLNDIFMKDLLSKYEKLESFKLNQDQYDKQMELIKDNFERLDRYNKENHTHYIQMENYIEKYLPLKT